MLVRIGGRKNVSSWPRKCGEYWHSLLGRKMNGSFASRAFNRDQIMYCLRVRLHMRYDKQTSELRWWKVSRLNGMSANLKCVLL